MTTTKSHFDMKPEQQRIAIAEICGWRVETKDGTAFVYAPTDSAGKGYHGQGIEYEKTLAFLPDYLNDLNAMHEAEKVLISDQRPIYAKTLHQICFGESIFQPPWHATAAQRAEAFLKTLNLWKE